MKKLIKNMSLKELVELKEAVAKEIISRHCEAWKKETLFKKDVEI